MLNVPDSDRRDNRRIATQSDCDITVYLEGDERMAVLTDISSGGFGLYLLAGVAERGQLVRFIRNDTIVEGVVAYTHREDSFQHVGVQRTADYPIVPPLRRGPLRRFVTGRSGGYTAIVMSVVLCIGGTWLQAAGGMEAIHAWRLERAKRRAQAELQARAHAEVIAGSEEARLLALKEDSDGFFSGWLGPDRDSVARRIANAETSWGELVRQLKLSASQQSEILDELGDTAEQTSLITRSKFMKLLTKEQRDRFAKILAGSTR